MIIKNLLRIIDDYNEVGIYFVFDGKLWWLNGKRSEKWCTSYSDKIYLYNNNVYGIGSGDGFITHILKNNKFEKYKQAWQSILNLDMYHIHPFHLYIDKNKTIYNYTTMAFRKNDNFLKRKVYEVDGFKLLHYDGFLYYFSGHKEERNEKFDLNTEEWSSFNHPGETILDVNLYGGLFYILFEDGTINTYNPVNGMWQTIIVEMRKNSQSFFS